MPASIHGHVGTLSSVMLGLTTTTETAPFLLALCVTADCSLHSVWHSCVAVPRWLHPMTLVSDVKGTEPEGCDWSLWPVISLMLCCCGIAMGGGGAGEE